MTYEDAVSIRLQQLNGGTVSPFEAALALSVIQAEAGKKVPAMRKDCKPRQLLQSLMSGPMERERFFERITEGKHRNGPKGPYTAFARLQQAGLLKCEVRLTEAGLRALGLEGPR